MPRKCLQDELVGAASSAMLWVRRQRERKHPALGRGEGMPSGCSDVRKRARAVNPSETVAGAGNFAVGAGAAAAWGTVRGCWGEGWAMDARPVLVLLLPCLPLASGRNAAGKLSLHETESADVFSCPNLTARCAAEFQRHYPILEILTAVCCLCPTRFLSSVFVIVHGCQKHLSWDWFPHGNPRAVVRVLSCSSAAATALMQLSQVALRLTDGGRTSRVQGKLWVVLSVHPSYVLCSADPPLLPSLSLLK